MTRCRWSLALLGATLLVPAPAAAQFGIGIRAGTLGFGPEAAVDVTDRVTARGGVGLLTLQSSTSFDGVPVVVDFPDWWFDVGVDFYLNEEFRLGGGLVIQPSDARLFGQGSGTVDIGGEPLTREELGDLSGVIEMDDVAAFALVGFGRHTSVGLGLFVDAGAAVSRSPSVRLAARGGTMPAAQLDPLLDAEARDFEDDMKTYFRIWPILSIGLRLGVGGGA